MESKPLLSLIVPVYNVEPYLNHFFQTVLRCDLHDCELLLSCGRSKDQSERICKDYAQRYPQIRLFSQNGAGLSNARNCALDAARGEYILFLDSDDFVDSSNLDALLAALRSGRFTADLIVTDFRRLECPAYNMVNIFQIGERTPIRQGISFLPQMLCKRQCFWNVWRYVFRAGFLKENGLRFWENRVSEDVDFITNVFLAEPTAIFWHCPYYIYVVGRGGSLMDSLDLKRLRDTVFILKHSISKLRDSAFRYAPQIMAQIQFEYLLNMALTVEIDPRHRDEALALYQDWRLTLADSPDWLIRIAARALAVVGVKGTAKFLHCMKILRRRWRRGIQKRGQGNDYYKNAISDQLRGRRQ